ncbi:hypothetical protein H0H87_008554 [Tephrocybe sp. NHM501043]|nr:hypothetical protein H0H87_008554 [Tephrocybe sp. NHM501043]
MDDARKYKILRDFEDFFSGQHCLCPDLIDHTLGGIVSIRLASFIALSFLNCGLLSVTLDGTDLEPPDWPEACTDAASQAQPAYNAQQIVAECSDKEYIWRWNLGDDEIEIDFQSIRLFYRALIHIIPFEFCIEAIRTVFMTILFFVLYVAYFILEGPSDERFMMSSGVSILPLPREWGWARSGRYAHAPDKFSFFKRDGRTGALVPWLVSLAKESLSYWKSGIYCSIVMLMHRQPWGRPQNENAQADEYDNYAAANITLKPETLVTQLQKYAYEMDEQFFHQRPHDPSDKVSEKIVADGTDQAANM